MMTLELWTGTDGREEHLEGYSVTWAGAKMRGVKVTGFGKCRELFNVQTQPRHEWSGEQGEEVGEYRSLLLIWEKNKLQLFSTLV